MTIDEAIKDLKNINENLKQFSKHTENIPLSKISFIMEKYKEITKNSEFEKFIQMKKTIINFYNEMDTFQEDIDKLKNSINNNL